MEYQVIETIEQANRFLGGRKAVSKLNRAHLSRLKQTAQENQQEITTRYLHEANPGVRMQFNAQIKSRQSIIAKIDQLLTSKRY